MPSIKGFAHRFRPSRKLCDLLWIGEKTNQKTVYDLLSNDIGEKLPLMEEYLIPPEQLTKAMQKQWTRSTGIDRILSVIVC